jgi:hypothetical protein
VGLANSFHVCNNFQKIERQEGFGYWKFDGDSVDSEGVYVNFPKDAQVDTEYVRLKQLWEEQLQKSKKTSDAQEKAWKELLEKSPREDVKAIYLNEEGLKLDAKLYSVQISEDNTVWQLMEKLAMKFDVEVDLQELTFDQQNLDGESTLKACGIGQKSVVLMKDTKLRIVRAISILCLDREPTHAMVLMGLLDETGDSKKRLYILWNWWLNMPLVAVSFAYLAACRCNIQFLPVSITQDCIKELKCAETFACDTSGLDHGEDTVSSESTSFYDE